MSPTRNRNFVRRVPDKKVHWAYGVRGRVEKRGRSREDLELRTRERGTCYFDGYEAEARLYAVTHRSSRGSFRARGSSLTAVGMGFLLRTLAPARLRKAWARIAEYPTSRRLIRAIIIVCWFAFSCSSLGSFMMTGCHLNFRVWNNHHKLPNNTYINLSVYCNATNSTNYRVASIKFFRILNWRLFNLAEMGNYVVLTLGYKNCPEYIYFFCLCLKNLKIYCWRYTYLLVLYNIWIACI